MSEDGLIYAGDHRNVDANNPDGFYHSCFLAGAKVLAAGEIKMRDGNFAAVSPKSGHYKPKIQEVIRFLKVVNEVQPLNANQQKVQWFPMRDDQLFPLKGMAKMFPVFWYSAYDFMNSGGNLDNVQPIQREAKTEGGSTAGRFVYDPNNPRGVDEYNALGYVGVGSPEAKGRLNWQNYL